eukprot:4264963-Prymnesium_polylepis.1
MAQGMPPEQPKKRLPNTTSADLMRVPHMLSEEACAALRHAVRRPTARGLLALVSSESGIALLVAGGREAGGRCEVRLFGPPARAALCEPTRPRSAFARGARGSRGGARAVRAARRLLAGAARCGRCRGRG